MEPSKLFGLIISVIRDFTKRSFEIYYNRVKILLLGAPAVKTKISELLRGPKAFYAQKDYDETLSKELFGNVQPPLVYVYKTSRFFALINFVKDSLRLISLIFVYRIFHCLAGKFIFLPSSTPPLLGFAMDVHRSMRARFDTNTFKLKRASILVDETSIDILIVGKPNTLTRGRWTVFALGNGEMYELLFLLDRNLPTLIENLDTNAIFFNYPGVGDSRGLPNRSLMVEVQRAILQFLEDSENGIGAKEIIMWGHSVGGASQAEAVLNYPLQLSNIKYLFVKSRSFTSMANTVSLITGYGFLGTLVKFSGWNFSAVKSSEQLKAPEVFLHTVKGINSYVDLSTKPELQIAHDGVVDSQAAIGNHFLRNPNYKSKYVLGMPERHNEGVRSPVGLAIHVKEIFAKESKKH